MKEILFVILTFLSFIVNANNVNDFKRTNEVFGEMKNFIDTIKPQTVLDGKYNVYILKSNDNNSDTCSFTFGYIRNDYELKFINFSYYTFVDSQIVLLDISPAVAELFPKNGIQLFENEVSELVLDKLFNTRRYDGIGGVNGTVKGEVVFINQDGIKKMFYSNAGEIPKIYSIFNFEELTEGVKIREINPFTQQPFMSIPVEKKRN